ncbi:hypothetical protein Q3G72_028115 [Acer saccharum]|nr:hypothetical protein Q3G72_028115 [Acer saccharum]
MPSYEKRYIEEVKLQSSEQIKDVAKEPSKIEIIPKSEAQQSNQQSKTSTSSAREQELDVFLLGGESDEDPVLLLYRPPTVRLGACEDYPCSLTMWGLLDLPAEAHWLLLQGFWLGFIPMTYLRWVFFTCFVCSSLEIQTLSQSCDPSDFLALKEFAGNLTNESIITSWSNNSFCCQWDGVVCGKEGVLPAELSNLKQLQVLDLSHNRLTGRVSLVLSGLKMIQSLNVSSNSFSGDLLELGGFPNLRVQCLDNCSSSLKELHVDVNSLSGQLPGSLYSFPSLQQLSLSENYFSGHLSKELSKLTSLNYLIIFGNHFSGELPNLRVLDLQNNSLTGSIDLNFTGFLALNGFAGQVPETFAKLKSLLFLSLSNNSFVDLSKALSVLQQCKNLTTLILTKNFIGEEIPKNVSGFESLMVLGIGYCGLKGHIPVWLSSCKKLHILDLSWNHLDGRIPPWIGSMENLFYLYLLNNSLTGEILTNLTELKSRISTNCCSSNLTSAASIPLFVK